MVGQDEARIAFRTASIREIISATIAIGHFTSISCQIVPLIALNTLVFIIFFTVDID